VDPDPHGSSFSGLFRIRIGNPDQDPGAQKLLIVNLQINPGFLPFKKRLLCLRRYLPFINFHVKILLFVTVNSDQDSDQSWFGSLDPDPDLQ
jgi:hypothetical protein